MKMENIRQFASTQYTSITDKYNIPKTRKVPKLKSPKMEKIRQFVSTQYTSITDKYNIPKTIKSPKIEMSVSLLVLSMHL